MSRSEVDRAAVAVFSLAVISACFCGPGESFSAEEPIEGDATIQLADDPKTQAAIERAVTYLRRSGPPQSAGRLSLYALALLKAGGKVDDPLIAEGIVQATQRVKDGVYQSTPNHYYTAGIDLMLLEAADAQRYRPQMEAIVRYIVEGQLDNGSWFYPHRDGRGDTSITQYAMLGLWAAARADIDVPTGVWDRAAAWHVQTQLAQGGFAYHPGEGLATPRRTMAAAAVGSLHIARLHLFPNQPVATREKPEQKKQQRPRKFRFLEPIDLDAPPMETRPKPNRPEPAVKPTTPLTRIDNAIERGINRLAADWSVDNEGSYVYYYLYALERMTALADIHMIGEHDWYAEASAYLLRSQAPSGSWLGSTGSDAGTCFGILCLSKATAKLLHREPPSREVGAGLLAGGRGLPENLSQVQVTDGTVKARKLSGPLDELLNELEKPTTNKIASVQSAVLERVQIGNHEELIGQTDRLLRLAKDPRPEVRRTALWALGRSGDVRHVPLLIDALQDADADVMVEARNALCAISRKPQGFGSNGHPYAGLPENADDAERSRARAEWLADAGSEYDGTRIERWQRWYFTVRPYDERDGLSENRLK